MTAHIHYDIWTNLLNLNEDHPNHGRGFFEAGRAAESWNLFLHLFLATVRRSFGECEKSEQHHLRNRKGDHEINMHIMFISYRGGLSGFPFLSLFLPQAPDS